MIDNDFELEHRYYPYCKGCGSCGDDGCCSPAMCNFGDDCEYKKANIETLKADYFVFCELQKYMTARPNEQYEKLWKFIEKKYDEWYTRD